MLDEIIKTQIRTTFDELKNNISGFKTRPTQNKMIAEVAKTLTNPEKNILVIEAPTGTGKTFAYLIPSIILAKKMGVKLIISSSNVALQEQLESKDLVDLKKFSNLDFNFLLIKGRLRYVCVRDLIRLVENNNEANPLFSATFNNPVNENEISYLGTLLNKFETKKWNGEIDSLDKPISNDIWQKISCNRFTCSGSKCEFYDDCTFFKQRKKINTADVLIANHDLILADIASGNNILPKIDESFIIFDEAHHLMGKALSHFNFTISLDNILNLNKQIDNIAKKITNISQISVDINTLNIKDLVSDIVGYAKNLKFNDEIFLFENGIINQDLLLILENLHTHINTIYNKFSSLVTKWQDYLNTNTVESEQKIIIDEAINNTIMQLENIILTLDNLIKKNEDIPQARWINKSKLTGNKTNYYLNSAKINIATEMSDLLFSKVKSAVLTSATLSSIGSFARLNDGLGIDKNIANYYRLASPFDPKNAKFIIADMKHSPKQIEHTEEVAEKILTEIKNNKHKGILVLFASNYQMNEVNKLIGNKIPNLLMQNQMTKKDILSQHKLNIDNNKISVIFGLDSFAEGVDLKGNYLSLVMITKLRFAVPTSPIEKTTNTYLESIGKNSFMLVSLPDAALKLVQACGRLLRDEDDSGTIIIFDNRLKTTRWGKNILDNLPDYDTKIQ